MRGSSGVAVGSMFCAAASVPNWGLIHYTTHPPLPAASGTPQRTPNSNFLRGVRWSPDGACLLTASDDNWWVGRGQAAGASPCL